MLDTSCNILNDCPLNVTTLSVQPDDDIDALKKNAEKARDMLDSGDGVLVLTDFYGSTPSNIACHLYQFPATLVIAGLSLPMLTKVLNCPDLSLEDSAKKAVKAGKKGSILCESPHD